MGAERGFTGADPARRRGGALAQAGLGSPLLGPSSGAGAGPAGFQEARQAGLRPGSGCGTLGTLPPLGELILWVPLWLMPPLRRPPQFPSKTWALERRQDPRSPPADQLPHQGCGWGLPFNPLRHMAQKRPFWKTGREAGNCQPTPSSDGAGPQEGSRTAPGPEHPADASDRQRVEWGGPGSRAGWLGWIFELFLLYSLMTPKRSSRGPPLGGQVQWVGPRHTGVCLPDPYTEQTKHCRVPSPADEKPSPPRPEPAPCCSHPESLRGGTQAWGYGSVRGWGHDWGLGATRGRGTSCGLHAAL